MTTKTVSPVAVIAAFAAIYLIWGSTYLAILIGLETLPPFVLLGLRFVLAGLAITGWCYARGERATLRAWRQNSISGTAMLFGGTGAVVWAEQFVPTGLAAIIVASMPFWFVLLDRRQWAENFSSRPVMLGIGVGLIGIVLLFGTPEASGTAAAAWAVVVLLLGCISWAGGSLYLKYHPTTLSTTMNAGIQSLAAGGFSLAVSGAAGEWRTFSLAAVSTASWLALAYLVLLGSIVAYLAYVWLLSVRPAVQVGTYAYVNPAVALLLGWLAASEPLLPRQMLALVIILSAVLLINLPKYIGSRSNHRVARS
jgi:drug/metabolite transporter (DMT)-like permease